MHQKAEKVMAYALNNYGKENVSGISFYLFLTLKEIGGGEDHIRRQKNDLSGTYDEHLYGRDGSSGNYL